jgi:hypothetical protein
MTWLRLSKEYSEVTQCTPWGRLPVESKGGNTAATADDRPCYSSEKEIRAKMARG